MPGRPRLEPALDAFEPGLVAQPQILVADPLAAGEQRISELDRLEMQIAVQRLEPFGRVARAVLELQHFEVPLRLIFGERLRAVEARPVQHLGELDRIFERELGPRADREMGGVRGVAEQDQIAGGPARADDPAEVEPGLRPRQVAGVRDQAVPVQIVARRSARKGRSPRSGSCGRGRARPRCPDPSRR